MTSSRLPSVLLCFVLCAACNGGSGASTDGAVSAGGEPAELAGTLAAHNEARAIAGVPALTWDPSLAAIAASWGRMCRDAEAPMGLIDHNAGRSMNYPEYVGENIYGSSGSASGPDAVRSWASEKSSYDYANNTCSGVCGHYTQVVWRTTTRVGCAKVDCPGLRFGSTIVCNYAPGGNVSNQRPF